MARVRRRFPRDPVAAALPSRRPEKFKDKREEQCLACDGLGTAMIDLGYGLKAVSAIQCLVCKGAGKITK